MYPGIVACRFCCDERRSSTSNDQLTRARIALLGGFWLSDTPWWLRSHPTKKKGDDPRIRTAAITLDCMRLLDLNRFKEINWLLLAISSRFLQQTTQGSMGSTMASRPTWPLAPSLASSQWLRLSSSQRQGHARGSGEGPAAKTMK